MEKFFRAMPLFQVVPLAAWPEDLVIGGHTNYDNDFSSLKLIMAEWSSDRLYTTGLINLRAGASPVLTGTGVCLDSSARSRAVYDDGSRSELSGNEGGDWF